MKKVKHRKNCNLFNSENIYSFNKTHLFDDEKRQKMKFFFTEHFSLQNTRKSKSPPTVESQTVIQRFKRRLTSSRAFFRKRARNRISHATSV